MTPDVWSDSELESIIPGYQIGMLICVHNQMKMISQTAVIITSINSE